MDRNTYLRYDQSRTKPKELPTIGEFLSFFKVPLQAIEIISQSEKVSWTHQSSTKGCSAAKSYKATTQNISSARGAHQLYACDKFIKLKVSE